MNGHAIPGVNALDHAMPAGNLEIPISFDSDSPNIDPHLFPCGDLRTNHIPRLKAEDLAWPSGTAAWKPQLVDITHASALSPLGSDAQRDHLLPMELFWRRCSYARRIQPMGFRYATLLSIPFGSTSRAGLNRQTSCCEALIEQPPRRVDRRSVLQGPQGLCLHLRKAEFLGSLGPFELITRLAGLVIRLLPPRIFGTMCSTSSATPVFWQ